MKKKTKPQAPAIIQVEHLVYASEAGSRKYLEFSSELPQSWRYDPKSINPFPVEIKWTADKSEASEIPAGQIEDVIYWLHSNTPHLCDRTTRTREI